MNHAVLFADLARQTSPAAAQPARKHLRSTMQFQGVAQSFGLFETLRLFGGSHIRNYDALGRVIRRYDATSSM
jgi:hypothetical protein